MDPTRSPTNHPNPRLSLTLPRLKTKDAQMTNPKLLSRPTKTAAHGGGAGSMLKSKVPPPPPLPRPLYKQRLTSMDESRDEAWQRRKGNYRTTRRHQRSRSVTNDDLVELRGSIDLGFGFEPDSPVLDPRLSDALPALGLFCAVNKRYSDRLSRCLSSSSIYSEANASSCNTIFDPGDDPETVKTRLRQWAQVVACSLRQF